MPPMSPDTPLRVLFVEDNAHVRESIAILLRAEGREIVCCESAEDALAAYRLQPCDVLITDVSLPRMSGTELASRILEAAPATWIVFASGYALQRGLEKFGPNVRSVPKPFETDEMEALLREIHSKLLQCE